MNKTVNDYLAAVKEFCQWGVVTRRWASNPLRRLNKLNTEIDVRRRRRPLTAEELRRLISTCESPERRLLYMTAAYSGLRFNELKTLKWSDLNLERDPPTATIEAKNSKSKRVDTIPLNEELADALRDWRKKRTGSEYVFKILTNYLDYYRRDLKAAGIPEIDEQGRVVDFHSLRHTYATLLSLIRSPAAPGTATLEACRHNYNDEDIHPY